MRATGSSAGLLLACGYSFRDDVELPPREESKASDYGTKLHKLCEEYADGTNPSPGVSDEMRADWLVCRGWIEENRSRLWQCEQPVAFDWKNGTARYLPKGEQARDYSSKTETELPGTIDILSPTVGGVTVYDWTTARSYGYKWPQLKLYAMIASRILGVRSARAVMLQVRDGVLTEDTRDYTGADLDAMAQEVMFAAATVKTSSPIVGGHCKELYCKLRYSCPAVKDASSQALSLTRQGIDVRDSKFRLSLAIEGPEHAAWMLGAVDAVDEAVSQIRTRLKSYADTNGGIPLGNGLVYQSTVQKREVADITPDAMGFLMDHGAEDAVETKRSMTWTALDKVVGKQKSAEIRKALAAMGAIKTTEFPKYEAKKAKS